MLNKLSMALLAICCALAGGCASTDGNMAQDEAVPTTTNPQPNTVIIDDTVNHSASQSRLSNGSQATATNSLEATPVETAPANAAPVQAVTNDPTADYQIGPRDLLEIDIFGVDELSRTVRVNSRGFISLPLIGLVKAAGLTSEQLEKRIAELLEKDYLQDPQVSVFIKEYTSQRVTVEGSVRKPGIYPLTGKTTLLQAIALAEGLDELADAGNIALFRTQPSGQRRAMQFSLNKIRTGDIVDPLVQGNDIVVVHKHGGKAFIQGVSSTLRGFIRPFAY